MTSVTRVGERNSDQGGKGFSSLKLRNGRWGVAGGKRDTQSPTIVMCRKEKGHDGGSQKKRGGDSTAEVGADDNTSERKKKGTARQGEELLQTAIPQNGKEVDLGSLHLGEDSHWRKTLAGSTCGDQQGGSAGKEAKNSNPQV